MCVYIPFRNPVVVDGLRKGVYYTRPRGVATSLLTPSTTTAVALSNGAVTQRLCEAPLLSVPDTINIKRRYE